jgi:hypothetical protein
MIDDLRSMDWCPVQCVKMPKLLAEGIFQGGKQEMRPAKDEDGGKRSLVLILMAFYKLLDGFKGISIFNEYDMKTRTETEG